VSGRCRCVINAAPPKTMRLPFIFEKNNLFTKIRLNNHRRVWMQKIAMNADVANLHDVVTGYVNNVGTGCLMVTLKHFTNHLLR
jgi:hypothetical protein